MSHSATSIEPRNSTSNVPSEWAELKKRNYGIAIAIILGLGAIAIGAAGLYSCLRGNMKPLHGIIMMAVGGGIGLSLFIFAIVGSLKNRQVSTTETKPLENSKPIDTQSDLVYGPEAWKRLWNVEVVGPIVMAPQVDLSKRDKILFYVPEKIKVKGEDQYFTVNLMEQISPEKLSHVNTYIAQVHGNAKISSRWVLIDKNLDTKSCGLKAEGHKEKSLPQMLEAVVVNLMVFADTGEKLYGKYAIRCSEKINYEGNTVLVHFETDGGLQVDHASMLASLGAVSVQRYF